MITMLMGKGLVSKPGSVTIEIRADASQALAELEDMQKKVKQVSDNFNKIKNRS